MPHTTRYLLWALTALCLAWPGIVTMLGDALTVGLSYALAHPTVTGTAAAFALASKSMDHPRRTAPAA